MELIRKSLYILSFVIIIWLFVTNLKQRIKCVKMTETELLINTPKSFVLKFKEC